jgi:type II secretory ATPase GspE/PulE/Tfp pilus assembly ATPase PilB-like protein
MGAEPYLIASVLEAVLAQRLVRRICTACRTPDTPPAADIQALGITPTPGVQLFKGRGCEECRGTGYRGRTGIYELFVITEDVRSLILRRASSRDIRRAAVEGGMTTLRQDGWARACQGITTIEEILRVTQEDI